jgi:hypothetical protein
VSFVSAARQRVEPRSLGRDPIRSPELIDTGVLLLPKEGCVEID